ncbi:hypothetical protein K1T71_003818 [Dendrolimus kikuchii]|uniref:Uncharacterized protein n=1 Tax=Dendrolimus kikuchii TaxID=765133 RepID=A0ACC1D9H7_9NEOP|nr:hypothetical protein K1T71_003818 [Dendrolimus kikuchii]
MSIFKVKQWWSNEKLQNLEPAEGVQNSKCLKIDRFNSYSDSDCILVSEGTFLRIYRPIIDQELSPVLLETDLNEFILHIDTGKFTGGSVDRQIIVLHPQSYAIYQLKRKEAHTDAGEQNSLTPLIKHSFTRKADSFTVGPFGNIKTRDLICIVGLEGSLSFFDQDTFLFLCIFQDVIIPGPVCYIENCDSFVICKSTWILEIYSYQQLREFSELNLRHNKKNIPQWVFNAGEEITHVQVIQTSSNFSSIVALGERHLYCFQDNGLMKYILKFDYMPIHFCAYLIGWYYEPGARLLIMVASDDSKLFIYEGTILLWSCDLISSAISISRCFLKYLSGGIVTLSSKGIVNVCYLGTEPDLNRHAPTMISEPMDPTEIQDELEKVEAMLQKVLENRNDNELSSINQILKIKADIGKPVQNLFQEVTYEKNELLHLLMCPLVVILSCEEPQLIQSVYINYDCASPFACSETTICLDSVNGTEIIENQVFLSSAGDITETKVTLLFTITDSGGRIFVTTKKVSLPLSLYCVPAEETADNKLKLFIEINNPCVEFSKALTDFSEEELAKYTKEDRVSFLYRSTKKLVTLRATTKQYAIEAEDFTDLTAILDHFILRLVDYFYRINVTDFHYQLIYDKEFVKLLTHRFLRSIEVHAKERVKLKDYEDELNILQRQFTVIQKRLLVQYGSLPPGDCDPLEFLMRDTHNRLTNCVNEILSCKETLCRAGNTITALGRLIMIILKEKTRDKLKITLIEEMMCLSSLYELHQDWEEAVTQALSYILNNIFKKSEKDKEKLAPVTEQGILSQVNLKRYMKQMKMTLDIMFNEIMDDTEKDDNKFQRVEEFIEVL